jgi:malonate transporter
VLSPLLVVLPVFALLFAGFACRKLNVLGPHASPELNRFVVYLALPALLFQVMAHSSWQTLYQPAFLSAFGLGTAAVFGITVLARWRRPRHLADASIDGLNASYTNSGFMGFPLCLAVLGQASLPLVTLAMIVTVCVLFAAAIVLIEISLQNERGSGNLVLKVGRSLIKNPLLMAPLAGAVVSACGWQVWEPLDAFLRLLGAAASPCALVALGLFLAEKRVAGAAGGASAWGLVAAKLVVQPVLTWWLAYRVFTMPPMMAEAAVLLAALPTGTGPFMLAEFYGREAVVTSRAILLSTVLSLLTITIFLSWPAAHPY